MDCLTCRIDDDYGSEMMHDFFLLGFEDGLINSDHMWLGYAPTPSCKDWPPVFCITVSCDVFGSCKIIKSCGVRLLYTEDMRDNNATMIEYISAPQPSSVILEELNHSVAEDSEVKRSLDGEEPSGGGLVLENDDDYNIGEEDLSGSGWSNEGIQSESTTDYSIYEGYPNGSAFHQDPEESASEDTISRRSLDEGEPSGNECSDNDSYACNGSKAEERKNVERRSHLQWNATFDFGFIFFVGVEILGSFWMKGRTSERKLKRKAKRGKNKDELKL